MFSFTVITKRLMSDRRFFFQVEPSVTAILWAGNKSWSDVFSNPWKNGIKKFQTLGNCRAGDSPAGMNGR